MLSAVVWGLVQGLTEFLPISSSGHLVIVPAFLEKFGLGVSQPGLAVTAVLHLGTLLAVLVYYRRDLVKMLGFRSDPEARRIIGLIALGTVPALVGLPLESTLSNFESDPRRVAAALLFTAVVLYLGSRIAVGRRRLEQGTWVDALVVGVLQATALVPGVSRSGMTIAGGLERSFEASQAARYSFLLAIPAIAGGGLKSLLDVSGSTATSGGPLVVGLLVAAVSGYAAIAILLRVLNRVGLRPFAGYCLLVGVVGLLVL